MSQFPQRVPGLCSRSILGRTAWRSQRPRGRQESLGDLTHLAVSRLRCLWPLWIGNNSRKATLYLSDPKLHMHRNFRPGSVTAPNRLIQHTQWRPAACSWQVQWPASSQVSRIRHQGKSWMGRCSRLIPITLSPKHSDPVKALPTLAWWPGQPSLTRFHDSHAAASPGSQEYLRGSEF